jgi:RsiW-degrading membrane proteinase PrsW (M82 family)
MWQQQSSSRQASSDLDTEISPALTSAVSGQPSAWLSLLALIVGLAVLTLGPLAGGLFIILSLVSEQGADMLGVTTVGVSMAVLGLGVGSSLAWAGYEGTRGRASRPFRPRGIWFGGCLAGSALALVVGQAIISFNLLAPITFPLFHVLGLTLPAIAILVLIGRGVGSRTSAPTQRQVIGQLALGALGTVSISFILEMVVALIGLVVVVSTIALTPGGGEQLAELQTMLADPIQLQDPQILARWLLKPEIFLAIAIILVVIVPLVEEGAKSIGVPLLALPMREKPTPAQGWVWGVAVGTGFAIAEGLFNGATSLTFWAGVALLRVGATAMHATTAGLTGLGWTRTLASRRPWPLLGGYLASVTLHSLWNGLTVLIATLPLWAMAQPGGSVGMVVGGLGVLVGLAGLALLALGIVAVAVFVTLWVRRG